MPFVARLIVRAALLASTATVLSVPALTIDAAAAAPQAPACSSKEMADILAPAVKGKKAVRLTCSPVLGPDSVITKQLILEGAAASGVTIDCQGGLIDGGKGSVNNGQDMIMIRSVGDSWQAMADNRPTDIAVRFCRIKGSLRVMGLGPNGQGKLVKASSKDADHTAHAKAAAPTNITLDSLDIESTQRIPVYLAPGVTRVSLTNSRFTGTAEATVIYLDAESARNTIAGNSFAVRADREVIAIDGSAGNTISGNLFHNAAHGGILVYRNCGEGGTIRRQAPFENTISDNTFDYTRTGAATDPAVWIGSRTGIENGFRFHCMDSSDLLSALVDPDDNAHDNRVINNYFLGASPQSMIRNDGKNNVISGNVQSN